MDKNALRDLLAQQVQEKVDSGYQVTLYAADVTEPGKIKRQLNAGIRTQKKKADEKDAYESYLQSVEDGTYQPPEDDTLQEGYRHTDWEREAKSSLTVHSRSKGTDTVIGVKPKPSENATKNQKPKNIRLDDLNLFR